MTTKILMLPIIMITNMIIIMMKCDDCTPIAYIA